MTIFKIQEEYHKLCCSTCAVVYFFPEKWCDQAQKEGKSWQCPNGHGQWFGEAEIDRIRRERDLAKQRLAQKDDAIAEQRAAKEAAERSAAAYRGQITKIKKRAGKGTCPCCNRHFTNLQRHMETQHPKFADEGAGEAA
jgi:hypothetical protein